MNITNNEQIIDLEFIRKCSTLTTVNLYNVSNLTDISALLETNIQDLTITECRMIEHLELLEDTNLKTLKIQSVMNLGVFSKNLKFTVEIST